MEQEPAVGSSIFCWKHDCDTSAIQLSRDETSNCILCNGVKSNSKLIKLAKFTRPFIRADQIECDLVLASCATTSNEVGAIGGGGGGRFAGFHVGICDSQGRVLEFDQAGLMFHKPSRINLLWHHCLKLNFLEQIKLSADDVIDGVKKLWDDTIIVSIRDNLTPLPYDGNSNNCLDFVVKFLCKFMQSVREAGYLPHQQVDEITKNISNKVQFCNCFVLTHTKHLARYLVLDRKLQAGVKFLTV